MEEGGNEACRAFGSGGLPFDRLRANGGSGRVRRGGRRRVMGRFETCPYGGGGVVGGIGGVFSFGGREVEVGDLVGVDGFDVVVWEGEWGLVA